MNLNIEIINKALSDSITNTITNVLKTQETELIKIAEGKALSALSEIQKIIQNEDYDDFEAIERIVCVFEKYGISAKARHDFS